MRGIFSLQKPFHNTENFTLEDIIASPEIPPDDAEFKRNGKPAGRQINLDAETTAKLRERFGNLPLGRAIRSLVGLSPVQKQDAWQEWEDDIIKERYSWGGSVAVKLEVERSFDAIRERARFLGVKFVHFKPCADWFTPKEVARIVGVEYSTLWKMVKTGIVKSRVVPASITGINRYYFEKPQIDALRKLIAAAMKSPMPIVSYVSRTHFLYKIEDNDAYLWCKKNTPIVYKYQVNGYIFLNLKKSGSGLGIPSCKVCRRALR